MSQCKRLFLSLTFGVAIATSMIASASQSAAPDTESEQSENASQNGDGTAKDKHDAPSSAITGGVVAIPTQATQYISTQNENSKDAHWPEWGLLLVTATLAWYTAKLWAETKNTATRQLRAYISVVEFKITNLTKNSLPYPFIVIRNSGQTPAREVRVSIDMVLSNYPWSEPAPTENQRITSNFYIGPGCQRFFDVREGEPISEADFQSILDNKKALWIHGSIAYVDVFGKSQITTFRFYKNRSTGVATEDLEWYKEGNHQT